MSLNACAELLRSGDPDRFLAVMAAPADARAVMFPIYAFNLEVARAPYVTSEPMLAEIRLQWWRDALEEIRGGQTPRRHEVVTPLAAVLDAAACESLSRIPDTRRWDVAKEPFLSEAQFRAHLDQSIGNMAWTIARLLGSETEVVVRKRAFAEGVARWFRAVPDLRARGGVPLVDEGDAWIAGLARDGIESLGAAPDRPGRIATLSAWETRAILRQAARDPARVREGGLGQSPFRKRAGLLTSALRI
jgi:hypothetical protein